MENNFQGSEKYWKQRYVQGGNSGVGSYGKFANFKAEVLNKFINEHEIKSVIEFGCGDGNQLKLANYPSYVGFDISKTAIKLCKETFHADKSKTFKLIDEYQGERADLVLSLDVLFHLIEDEVFDSYMMRLFHSSDKYVIIYSSNTDKNEAGEALHVKHRHFTRWIEEHLEGWKLIKEIPNKYPYRGNYLEGSFANFYIYKK
jgi:predicted TPR repeat methyltransferase